uniref:Uncharacterized protein MGC13033 n=1 Tax=Homo sapiens TaxID=9606 RepID=Q4ZG74_HUMAN
MFHASLTSVPIACPCPVALRNKSKGLSYHTLPSI